MSIVYFRFPARHAGPLERSTLIEELLVRAAPPVPIPDWRADAFAAVCAARATVPAVGAAAFAARPCTTPADPPVAAACWVCVATPVHLRAGMSSVVLSEDGLLELEPDECSALIGGFNDFFRGAGAQMIAGLDNLLLCAFDRRLDVVTHDPQCSMGRDVFDLQPTGIDGGRLKRLLSEVEMWLFDHAVNRSRSARGLLPITGLWLWGGGATLEEPPAFPGWTAGCDPLFRAFGSRPGWPGDTQSGVVVCREPPGSATWGEVELKWLRPAAQALTAGRLRRLDLSAGDRRLSVGAGRSLKFWRRTRPWWEFYGIG